MTKEVFIALIQKDIRELDMIAQGLYETELPSPTMIKLASAKARDVLTNLQMLTDLKIEDSNKPLENAEIKAIESTINEEAIEINAVVFEQNETPDVQDESPIEGSVDEDITYEDGIETAPVSEKEVEETVIAETVAEEITIETVALIEEQVTTTIEEEPQEKVFVEEIVTPRQKCRIEIPSRDKNNSFANSLTNKKISDIKQAISIGDRFHFQRELFSHDAELMNQTFAYLNFCTNVQDAEEYLSANFDWKTDNETVVDFLNLVSRLFINE